jgi:MFS family permease
VIGRDLGLVRFLRDLPAGVLPLFVAKLVMTTGTFVLPFLSLYLSQALGLDAGTTGLVLGLVTAGSLAGAMAGGYLADHRGRKKTLLLALLVCAAFTCAVPFVTHVALVVALLMVASFALAAEDPAFNALVGDLTEERGRRGAYSLIYVGFNVGFALGPLLASFLYERALTLLFVGDAAATAMAAGLVFFFVRERWVPPVRATAAPAAPVRARGLLPPGFFARNGTLILFCLVYIAHPFVYAQTNFALPLFLRETHPLHGVRLYGVMMAVNGVAVVALTPLVTLATRRLKATFCLAAGLGFYVLGFGMFAWVSSVPWLVLAVLLWSAGEILNNTNARAFIADQAPPAYRGRFNTLLSIVHEAGYAASYSAVGVAMGRWSFGRVWAALGAVAALGSGLMLLLRPTDHRAVAPAVPGGSAPEPAAGGLDEGADHVHQAQAAGGGGLHEAGVRGE